MLSTLESHFFSPSPKSQPRRNTGSIDSQGSTIEFIPCHQGWLQKKSGAFRRWRRRYFLLTENGTMAYFEREDLVKCCGSFNVLTYDIEVLETIKEENSSDVDKFDFILKSNDPQAKVAEYVLSALFEDDRRLWVEALKRVIYRRKGGAIFGFPLKEVMVSPCQVPQLVQDCCHFIRQHGLQETGIFRLSGRKKLVLDLADSYDRGSPPAQLDLEHFDVHTVAGVLKKFLSELAEPLIPYEHYDKLKATGFYVYEGCEIPKVIEELQNLPREHYILLKYLCEFLHEVASHSNENRMNTTNLAGLFAPHILRSSDSDPNIEASSMEIITRTLDAFITHHDTLFFELPNIEDKVENLENPPPEVVSRVPPKRPPAPSQYFSIPWLANDKHHSDHSTASSVSCNTNNHPIETDPTHCDNTEPIYPSLAPFLNSQTNVTMSDDDSDSDDKTMSNIRTVSNRMRQLLSDTRQLSRERDHYQQLYKEECLTSARLRKEISMYEQQLQDKDRELTQMRETLKVSMHHDSSGGVSETTA